VHPDRSRLSCFVLPPSPVALSAEWQLDDSCMVDNMRRLLPYGTGNGICHYAFILGVLFVFCCCFYFFRLFLLSFSFSSGNDKSCRQVDNTNMSQPYMLFKLELRLISYRFTQNYKKTFKNGIYL